MGRTANAPLSLEDFNSNNIAKLKTVQCFKMPSLVEMRPRSRESMDGADISAVAKSECRTELVSADIGSNLEIRNAGRELSEAVLKLTCRSKFE